MRCDTARRLVSDHLDLPDAVTHVHHLDDHLATCAHCRGFRDRLEQLRSRLAVAPVGEVPDVAPAVRAVLEQEHGRRSRRRRPDRWGAVGQAAAAFVVAFGLAAAAIGVAGPPTAQATDVADLVQAAQTSLQGLDATVHVTEYGWHPDVPERRYEGRLTYQAPETLGLHLRDVTRYPTDAWRANDVTIAVAGGRSWRAGLAGCPPAGLPDCTPAAPRTTATVGREPFDPADPVPLDLVLPVASFVVPEPTTMTRRLADRDAVGVTVPVAQVAPLFDALLDTGNWRPLHPTDRAQVWLDAEVGVPLLVDVHAVSGFERDRWAAARGLEDADGASLLVWRLTDMDVDPDPAPPLPLLPGGTPVQAGFRDTDRLGPGTPVPRWLPDGMRPHRFGRVGDVEVAAWSDGAAWLKVRSTTSFEGDHLFGRDHAVVRRVDLDADGAGTGIGYLAEGGRRVHVHGDDVDVEVTGSLPPEVLVRVASHLGVHGRAVPPDWAEAATASVADAVAAMPGLLLPVDPPAGFTAPAVAVVNGSVVLAYSGGGARAVTIVQSSTDVLAPPVDDVVMSVEVRGLAGRYTPERGTLEWVESGRVVTVRSHTLGLPELLAIAASLEVAS